MQIVLAAASKALKDNPVPPQSLAVVYNICVCRILQQHMVTNRMGVCLPACPDLILQQVKDPASPLWNTKLQATATHKRSSVLPAACSGNWKEKKIETIEGISIRYDNAFVICSEALHINAQSWYCRLNMRMCELCRINAPQPELQPDARLFSLCICCSSCRADHISVCAMNTHSPIWYCNNHTCASSAVRLAAVNMRNI